MSSQSLGGTKPSITNRPSRRHASSAALGNPESVADSKSWYAAHGVVPIARSGQNESPAGNPSMPRWQRQRLADIRKCLPRTKWSRGDARAKSQHRHVFAGMVMTRPSRVTAMVRRRHHQITQAKKRVDFRQPRIELFQRCGVAGNIPAMAVEHVEIYEIGKYQCAIRGSGQRLQRGIKQRARYRLPLPCG